MQRILLLALVLSFCASAALAQPPWYDRDWSHRVSVIADAAMIEGTNPFSDFALLVTLDGVRNAAVFATSNPDGSDLLFTTDDGVTLLEREIVHYDAVAEEAEIWVRVSSLSKTENGFYLYYTNPAATLDPSPTAAWSDEYRAVYHFEDDPAAGVLRDSSPQAADAILSVASAWTASDVETGAVGQSWYFNGDTHHIRTKSISTADSSYAISAWLKHTNVDNTDFFFQAQPGFWHLAKYGSNNAAYATAGTTLRWNPTPISYDGDYHHFLWSFDAVDDTIKFYYDGNPGTIWGNFPPAPPHYTGRLINPTQSDWVGVVGPMFASVVEDYHDGGADEFRIREGVSSPERVLTEYRSQHDNTGFIAFGLEETLDVSVSVDERNSDPASLVRLRLYPNPTPGQSSIQFTLPEPGPVRIGVYDVAGRRVASLVDQQMQAGTWTHRWSGRDDAGRPLAAGVYFLRLQTSERVLSVKATLVR